MITILRIILFPLVFLILLPIEYPIWKTMKQLHYNVPNYVKFFWYRVFLIKDKHYVKIK